MEMVCLDFLSLERSKGGYENILVITDHFSRYAQAFPITNTDDIGAKYKNEYARKLRERLASSYHKEKKKK
ncbi:hypothetical protein DPMN_181758 [Dreissena polymorpha]|uniref:Uncharacterized protein n=1 Tax=Dreissena polymorpha TaxID=45954 RepID=A0A9D4DE52_DREPO|nr:hypothetical protein DPMN_181758 [Dreissena polymorpha]